MAAPEQPPASLAQLIRQRAGGGRTGGPPSRLQTKAPAADKLGQFGFSFEAEPAPAVVPKAAVAKPVERRFWTVGEIISALRGRVERDYADVWIEGEISNCRPAPSGHLYFTLKDGDAQLPVVLFRREASLLKWKPADGLCVLARGRVSVFESRGQLQLIATTLEPRGTGALQLAFEQLKAKLRGEGLFDAERKRALPPFPSTVGVITSTQGAVLRDIATVVKRRHARLNLLVFPATVQGPTCAGDVMRGLRYFNVATAEHRVDVIVIARGGGSAEDLSGFNDEALARAIAASDVPVMSAIGHETDYTIADFVADLRAPTPSAAAELVTAAQHRVEEHIDQLTERLMRAMRYRGMQARQGLLRVGAEGVFLRMRDSINRRHQRVDAARFQLERASQVMMQCRAATLHTLRERMQRQDVQRGLLVRQAQQQRLQERLQRAGTQMLQAFAGRVQRGADRLAALSPTAILQRGYALVYREDGALLRDAADAPAGTIVRARLAQGEIVSEVVDHERTGNTHA